MSHFKLSVSHAGSSATVDIYEARPQGPPRGGLIIVQEIFGVTDHIRSVADRYAQEGFVAWAPAFFDVFEKDVVLPTDKPGMEKGIALAGQLGWEWPLATVKAASEEWTKREGKTPLGLIGYCWGGSVAWLSATRLGNTALKASVGYYGSKAYDFRNEKASLPVMLHFGKNDQSIPLEKVEAFKDAQPTIPVELYDAGHGFNRDGSHGYSPEAAKLAHDKTIAFFVRNGFNLF